uniref:Small G protein signaling modulator 1 n=1 Tax=Schistocephalus solidus TaxID=70667 RepID=A0A0X3NJC8_SCHSO
MFCHSLTFCSFFSQHLSSARQSAEINGKSSSSSAAEDPDDNASRLSADLATSRIVFEGRDRSPQQRRMSMDLTDGTEDCTLTTTDDDTDAVSSSGPQHHCMPTVRDKTQLETLCAPQTTKLSRTVSCPNSLCRPGRQADIQVLHSRSANHALFDLSDSGRESNEAGGKYEVEASKGKAMAGINLFCTQPGDHELAPGPKRRSRYSREETSGVCFSADVLEALAINIHRIDKDVARCDRNHPYFTQGLPPHSENMMEQAGGLCVASLDASANLYRLRTIMCTWTWQHLETGYVQGMCDLLAPLLVILDDEALAHACFCQLMQTMLANFPLPGPSSGGVVSPSQLERVTLERAPSKVYEYTRPRQRSHSSATTVHASPKSSNVQPPAIEQLPNSPSSTTGASPTSTSNPSASTFALGSSRIYNQFQHLQALLEVIDPVIASHMHLSEENAHLYFYRWFLLDFKRELKYDDVFRVWETIWTARRLVTHDFGVFLAFALIQCYRDIILFYCVDYTDIIRFYNERAELHEASKLLTFARDMVYRLQTLIATS